MSADKTGGRPERIRLEGCVSSEVLFPLVSEVWRIARHKPGTHFHLDCAAATEFSNQALADLAKLRRDVRSLGCELVLINCDVRLLKNLKDPLFQALFETGPALKHEEKTTGLQGPHATAKWKAAPTTRKKKVREPYFLRLHGTRYQRFWLN